MQQQDVAFVSAKPLYLAAAASGLLLYASFFPLDLGFLAWFALVPLLFLVRSNARPRHVYAAAFVGGLLFYVPAIQWMHVAHAAMYATWIILSLYCALCVPLGLWLIRRLDRVRVPLTIAAPAVWVGLEYMRAHFPTGFPWMESLGILNRIGFGWYFLGYSQHDCLPLIQIADVAGVYGVSLLIVLVNVVVFLWLSRLKAEATTFARPWIGSVVAVSLLALVLSYGYARLDHEAFTPGPRVAALQSNLPQSVKMDHEMTARVVRHMAERLAEAKEVPSEEFPDLIVWPETTFSEEWYEMAPGTNPMTAPKGWPQMIQLQMEIMWNAHGRPIGVNFQQKLVEGHQLWQITQGRQANQLLGLNGMELEADGTVWKYNSAKFIGRGGIVGPRYDKMHLVPFGEYVPLRTTFPWMKMFTPYTNDYSCKPGEHWSRFPLEANGKTYHFGCLICYEDSDPALARAYARNSPEGPAVDFLVNISNDGWFDGTEEHEQHLAICRFRAIECRRAIVRAVNMGISGFIDSDGRVVRILGPTWAQSKKVAGVVSGIVPIDHRETLYAGWGDWLPLLCWGIVLAGLTLALLKRGKPVAA